MACIAQTNLQLFNQLQALNYSEADLVCINRAYNLTARSFSGYYRGSGKPFLAHLIGTASILASVKAPIETVAAGLLHAIYNFGRYTGDRPVAAHKRLWLRKRVGGKIEAYVAQYSTFVWNEQTIPEIFNSLPSLEKDEIGSQVLLVRLANELEDHLDLGVLYCRNLEGRLAYIRNSGSLIVDMANALGFPSLSDRLSKTFQETLEAEVPQRFHISNDYSYLVPTEPYLLYLTKKTYASILYRFDHHRWSQKFAHKFRNQTFEWSNKLGFTKE
ncbi:MAG: DUF6817 domain-containing protein [Cyanobacteria bacterium J06635_15]